MAGPSGPPLVHLKVYVSGVINTSVQLLWDLVRDYGQAHTWFGTYRGVKTFTSLLPNQINCQIGAMRSVIIGHSGFVDQLDALDDERYIMKYKLISHPQNTNPFPGAFLNFRANIQLKEVTRGPSSFMQWTGEFDTDPQDCEIMRQSIEELFEAGFQELENLVAPPPLVHPMYQHGGQAAPPMGVVGEGQLGHLQRDMGGMNLKPTDSMPTGFGPMSGTSFPPARSPRTGPISMVSEPAPPTAHSRERAAHESSSLAPSPQTYDGTPRSGSGGPVMNQWTSGGSNSTINLSTLPNRRSGEEVEGGYSRGRQQRARTTQEGIPEGRPYLEAPALPAAFQDQVNQRHGGVTQQPDGCARYHQQEQGSVDLPQRDSLGSVSDQADHATDMQYHHHHSGRHPDPLLQEREYKASLLAGQPFQRLSHHTSDASLQSAQLAQETASEPGDWGRAMQAREEVGVGGVRSASNSQGSSPHVQPSETSKNHQEWVRLMQQRELDLQLREEAQNRRKGSPLQPTVSTGFGAGGPFGAASNRGGPFAAASGLPPRDSGHAVRRSTSQQSLSSLLSAGGSGQLDRSVGSMVDERMGATQHHRGATTDYHSADRARDDPRSMWPSG